MVKKVFPKKQHNYHLTDQRNVKRELEFSNILNLNGFSESLNIPGSVIDNYLKHQFNYLGSGWKSHNKADKQIVVLNTHQSITEKMVHLIDDDYLFIDWQRDIDMDFSFDAKKTFNNQIVNEGVDIKNVWELGRLQHLTRLSFTAIHSIRKESLINEFKNQCLDFFAQNPVGMGVQWGCAMDVGIRVSNLLIAYDVCKQLDETGILNKEFDSIFMNSIYNHGEFIFNHLEYKEGLTGNHYLFNVSGLLFIGSYLKNNDQVNTWREFSMKEIEKEMIKQFFNDGGNFEGSTAYHCLSSEMMVYSAALMLRNNYNFNEEFVDRLCKSGQFIKDVLKPNDKLPQFGDNDSGRYFKINYLEIEGAEDLLDYKSLLASYDGLYTDIQFSKTSDQLFEYTLIKQISNNKSLSFKKGLNTHKINSVKGKIPELKYSKDLDITYKKIDGLLEEIEFHYYPDFGISVFKSPRFYLAISTISNSNMHHSWGHVHNDKLSFELWVEGKDIVSDSGTYCYTSSLELRNRFRSVKAHHTAVVEGEEQNKFLSSKQGLFYLDRETKCKVISIKKNAIELQVKYYGVTHVRRFVIHEDKLSIQDFCNTPFKQNINKELKSKGYGVLIN